MDAHHADNHLAGMEQRRLKLTLVVVVVVMVSEVVGGLLSNSLALLGDAGHMLVDALALTLALFAMSVAGRPSTPGRTYGYHRVEIMAALANGVTLVLLSFWIFYEAYQRFLEPPTVKTPLMLAVATIGLVANLAGVLLLRQVSHEQLNVKAAFWHIMGDTLSSVGVIVAAVIISVTGWSTADPIAAVLIGAIILWGSVRIVRESADILLEATPKHVETENVVAAIMNVPGVEDTHDVHIWTITSGLYSLSAHLVVNDQAVSQGSKIVDLVNQELARRFSITHTTFQMECERCQSCPAGFICDIGSLKNHAFGEHH